MNIYLVGGAVRDALLGLPVTERDWVVVGATPEQMLQLGYQPVGKDFPVFLHPKTHEEYALARTERKTGRGYKGFTFYAAPDVTLIADLERRDLTINAMAQTADGQLVDPYGGQTDLYQRILRHVSPAFQEDPVRILRIGRFAARFTDFSIHPDTLQLMRQMVNDGEVDALVPERVWQEFSRALDCACPARFLEVLQECGALAILFPEIKLSPDNLSALAHAVAETDSGVVRFAALLYSLDELSLQALSSRYRIPREYSDLALLVCRWYQRYFQIHAGINPETILQLMKAVDARRRPQRFQQFLQACDACSELPNHFAHTLLQSCATEMQMVDLQSLLTQNLRGEELAAAIEQLHLKIIKNLLWSERSVQGH